MRASEFLPLRSISISEEMSDEQRELLTDMYGMEIVDEVSFGSYDIVLLYSDYFEHRYGTGLNLGFQRQGADFTGDDQFKKFNIGSLNLSDLRHVLEQVKVWIGEHGKIIAGSLNDEKNATYRRVFARAGIPFIEKQDGRQKFFVLG